LRFGKWEKEKRGGGFKVGTTWHPHHFPSPRSEAREWDFELKTSSPRPSPPASLGREGAIIRSISKVQFVGAGANLKALQGLLA